MRYDSCRQCTKRRIKCDKGAPRCAKCIKKGIECSGVGKTYQFVENATPKTIETSSSARSRHGEPHHDGGHASDETSNTAVHSRLQSTCDDSTEFVVDRDEDVEAIVSSSSGIQQSPDGNLIHQLGHRAATDIIAAQRTQSPLDRSVALYKPGQMMLLDHFAKVIAPYMTVAHDVDNNGYRDLILPLAHEDPLVQRAVMVVSALHLGTQQNQLLQQAEMGRAAILARLRHNVMGGSVENVLTVSTWATLLILLVGETVTGSSDFVHLFSMLRSLMSLQNGGPLGSRGLSTFLDYQRRLFLFMTPPLLGATEPIEPWASSEDLYFEFFGLSPSMERAHRQSIAIIKEAFKLTHTLTMQQNNALLPDAVVNTTLNMLGTLIAPITKTAPGAHTLVWVYFIAAAESRTHDDRIFFSQRLRELYDIGRFGNIPVALATLERIWNLDLRQRWTRENDIIVPVLVI